MSTVVAMFSAAVRRHSGAIALAGPTESLTYGELDELSSGVAAELFEAGCVPGDRVAILGVNRGRWVAVLLGVLKAGMIAVPLNSRLHPTEVAYVLDHSGARALFLDDELATAATFEGAVPGDVTVHPLRTVAGRRGAPPRVDVRASDPAWLFYTSGTTGRPKGATLTHGNLVAMATGCLADMCDFRSSDVSLHIAPLSHGSGLYLLPSLARGSANLLLETESLDTSLVLRTIEERRVTVIPFTAPTGLIKLLEDPAIGDVDLGSLRRIVYGGAPMHEAPLRRVLARFGAILVQLYGQGESPMTATYLPAEAHIDGGGGGARSILSSVGWARTGTEIEVHDDQRRPVPDGQAGEIVVRGATVMAGYWNDPLATAATVVDGWLHTGDVGIKQADGIVHLLDRAKDLIISGGNNIYAVEVEDAILHLPGVRAAAVVGLPDDYWGERVHAVVVAEPQVTAADVIEQCRRSLASYKKPTSVSFADSLPTSAYGKVLKRELRDQLGAGPS